MVRVHTGLSTSIVQTESNISYAVWCCCYMDVVHFCGCGHCADHGVDTEWVAHNGIQSDVCLSLGAHDLFHSILRRIKMNGGKCGIIVVGVVIGLLGLLLMGNPLGSPNYFETMDTIQQLGALFVVGAIALGAILFGTGSRINAGSGHQGDNYNITYINQPPPPDSVNRWMSGRSDGGDQ